MYQKLSNKLLFLFTFLITSLTLYTMWGSYIDPHRYPFQANSFVVERDPSITEHPLPRIHVVEPGETLQSISKMYYGSPHYTQTLYQANQGEIKQGETPPPGTQLLIPHSP